MAHGFPRDRHDAERQSCAGGQRQRRVLVGFRRRRKTTASPRRKLEFIATRDSFYMASVSETGWPYVQHRGGPAGFLRVLDDRTLAFADFRGNRQYISLGNVTARRPRRADPDGLSAPAAPQNLRPDRDEEISAPIPRLPRSSRCPATRQGRAHLPAASRSLRLELPAAHHAAIQRSGARACARAVPSAARSARSGKRGLARQALREGRVTSIVRS